ncbi:MAG TPA: biotin--[acetyl-CoA-carboxylase] ligase [Alphaproteobacteria bacterium]|jgi:BirA family biotin operon repressor/biotin-[acetyl-CoA-carboxylase] ligase|nr:biotin--[acetyl-CoA-carboxylase] ligase [Alphaproteobacteria bacterium]
MEAVKLPPAYRLVELDETDSTNEEAKRLARAGAEDGTLVWAKTQTAGRGRSGRKWDSPRGNLYLSIVLRPECSPGDAAQLGFVAAVGLGDALSSVLPPMVEYRFKWPNDVLMNDRKLAGILLEAEGAAKPQLDWLVVGIGVNVRSHPENVEFPATNLEFETGVKFATTDILEAFGRHFLSWVNRWLDEGFAPVRAAWRSKAQSLGERIRVRVADRTLSGRFLDIDADGALQLDAGRKAGGVRRITAGDVFFGR